MAETPLGIPWEFMGVFTTEQAADDACTGWNDFYAPADLNVRLPDETTQWEGLVFPLASREYGKRLNGDPTAMTDGEIRRAAAIPGRDSIEYAILSPDRGETR